MMVTSFAGFIGTLYGGHLSDAIGRKKVVLFGSVGTTIGWLLAIIANWPGHDWALLMFAGILLVEIFSSFYAPAYEAMLIDLTDESNRRFVYTINYWLINIAVMLGAGIAGLFYDRFFLELLLALLVVNILCFTIAWFFFEETRPEEMEFEHGSGLLSTVKNYGQVLTDKPFVLYTLGSILMACVLLQIDNYIPVHLELHFHTISLLGQAVTSSKMLSVMVLTNTILIVFFMTTVNRLTKKLALLPQLVSGSAVFAFGILLAMTFEHFAGIFLAVVVYTIGEMVNVPASQVLRAEMMNQDKIGSYTGFVSMANPLGAILAGLMVSVSHFAGQLGVQVLHVLVATLGIVCIVAAAKWHAALEKTA